MASIPLLNLNPKTQIPSLLVSPHKVNPRRSHIPCVGRQSRMSATTPATERLISAAAYSLPFVNSLQYGGFLIGRFPIVAAALEPIMPIVALYRSMPYASFVAFFGLYLGVVRNTSLSRYVRFNAMQAVTLDILLVIPVLLQRILSPGRTGIALRFTAALHTALFVFSAACFAYGVASSVLGRTPYLPFVADAAERQI